MHRVSTVLAVLAYMLVGLGLLRPAPILAQEAPAYCDLLSDDDCALLLATQEAMAALQSVTSTGALDFVVRQVPDMPVDEIAVQLNTHARYAMDDAAQAQRLALAAMSPDELAALLDQPAALIDVVQTIMTGLSAETSAEMTISQEVADLIAASAEEEGDPIPFPIPTQFNLSVRVTEQVAYVNLSEIATMMPGLRAVGDVWLGMDLAPLFDMLQESDAVELDMQELSRQERAQLAQVLGAFGWGVSGPLATSLASSPQGEQVAHLLLVERMDDDVIDGRAAATFVTTIDYAALLREPAVQEMLIEQMFDQGFLSPNATADEIEAALTMAATMGPPLLETLGLALTEHIDLETSVLLRSELALDWEIARFLPLLGEQAPLDSNDAPEFVLAQVVTYADHNASVTVDVPAAAIIVATDEVIAMVEAEMAREEELRALEEQTRAADESTQSVVVGELVPLGNDADALYADAQARLDAGDIDGALSLLDEAIALAPDNADYYTARGRAYFFADDMTSALVDFSAALEIAPNAVALNGRGAVHDALGDRAAAVADYEAAMELDPDYPFPFYNLGLIHVGDGDADAAIAMFNQALAVDPGYVGAMHERGKVYYNLEQYERALEDFDGAIAQDPNFAPAYVDRGNVRWIQERYDEAEADYTTAISLVPGYAVALNNRGRLAYVLGDYAAAVADFDQALFSEPEYVLALYNRAEAYFSLGEYARSVEDFNQVEALDPDYGDLYYARGRSQMEAGDYAAAVEDFTAAIARDPSDQYAYFYRGESHYALGNYDEEFADYTSAIDIDPTFADAYYYRALSSWDWGAREEALADLDTAIDIAPNDTYFLNDRALLLLELDEIDAAIADLDRVIELAPDDALAYINRGYAYSLLGEYEQALADADAALDRDTLSAIAWGNRADANGQLGNIEQALEDFEQALFIDPEYATAYLDRGLLLERLERFPEAVEDLTRYLELAPNAENRAEIEAKIAAME